jgi:3-oxoacyl-[acyl-carrier-protein] synthase-3
MSAIETTSAQKFGIGPIGTYLGAETLDNAGRADALDTNLDFLDSKIGTKSVKRKQADQETSDLAVEALRALEAKGVDLSTLEAMVLVTQNPDGFGLPHTSAIVHEKMGLPLECATFDISLGCSGFVYGIPALMGFLEMTGKSRGVLVTADPYSKVIDNDDRNTVLLFGDGAAATYVSRDPQPGQWTLKGGRYGSEGKGSDMLTVRDDRVLFMNGREVFNFAAIRVPREVKALLESLELTMDDIDQLLLHQGSKYIVDSLARRLRAPEGTAPVALEGLGNTVSSTIPLLLDSVTDEAITRVLACGFGVGFSYASAIFERVKP